MKKKVVLIISFLLILSFVVCVVIYTQKYLLTKSTSEEVCGGTLYIYGKEITSENVKIHHRQDYSSYCELPFIEVLKGLGCDLKWKDDNTVLIKYKNNFFTLNLSEMSLLEVGGETDFIFSVNGGPGSKPVVLEKELILQDILIIDAVEKMGINIRINFEFNESVVYITERDD